MAEAFTSQSPSAYALYLVARAWLESLYVADRGDPHATADFILTKISPHMTPAYYCGGEPPPGVKSWRSGWKVLDETALRMGRDPAFRATLNFRRGVENFTGPVLFIASD